MMYEAVFQLETLEEAWQRVRANRPPPGIDRVRWEDFEANLSFNLAMLQKQLQEEGYQPLPVSIFTDKRKKTSGRSIGLSSIRDRVVQQAVLKVMGPAFEPKFLPCSYAYRPGQGALAAVRQAGRLIAQGSLWVLQMDVANFFDTLDHTLLLQLIGQVIPEKPFLRLLARLLKAKIFREMALVDNELGTQQGSGLSPLLSNIYLHPLDKALWERYRQRYLRYCDDLTLFAEGREPLAEAEEFISRGLSDLKLAVNLQKTTLNHVSNGIIYLGFHLDVRGQGPAQKAVAQLQAQLEAYPKLRQTDDLDEKVAEIKTMVRGWYNYYQTIRPLQPPNLLTLLALVELALDLGETAVAKQWLKESEDFTRTHPLAVLRLGELFSALGLKNQAIREYALAVKLDPHLERAKEKIRSLQADEANIHDTIRQVQMVLHQNPHYREGYQQLAECYRQLGLYGFAARAHQKALELDDDGGVQLLDDSPPTQPEPAEPPTFDYRSIDLQLFLRLFQGRQDAHAKQWADERGRWGFVQVARPLKTKDIFQHLQGEVTLGVYPVTAQDTVRFLVFDVDTAKRAILQTPPAALPEMRLQAHQDILRLQEICAGLGLTLYIEDSGYKGRHGWLFFGEEVPAALALQLGEHLLRQAGSPAPDLIRELFPMGKSLRHQSIIKLPLGINRKSNRRCLFLTPENQPFPDQALFLQNLKTHSLAEIRQLVHREAAPEPPEEVAADWQKTTPGLFRMVNDCRVLKHLLAKAKETNYLTHYERLCLLYTLTFAGEAGCRLLHQTIASCLNYDYQYTQRQIDQRLASPISCAKIMEYFPELTKALDCHCSFQLPRRGYPSPTLYLLAAELAAAAPPPAEPALPAGQENEPHAAAPAPEEPQVLDFAAIFASEAIPADDSAPSPAETPPEGSGNVDSPPARELQFLEDAEETLPFEPTFQEGPPAEAAPPAPTPTLPTPAAGEPQQALEAYQLALEYLQVRLQQARQAQRRQELAARLTAIFQDVSGDTLITPAGLVQQRRRPDGTVDWLVTSGAEEQ